MAGFDQEPDLTEIRQPPLVDPEITELRRNRTWMLIVEEASSASLPAAA